MRNIILVGYMACGKSSIGRILAKRLGCRLLDTDTYIEQKAGKLIKEIFADEGEAYFRQLETDCIQELIQKYVKEGAEQVVFATIVRSRFCLISYTLVQTLMPSCNA